MPELPEMETYRRRLSDWVQDRAIVSIEATRPKRLNRSVTALQMALNMRRVHAVKRRGKTLAFILDDTRETQGLYVHLMLGGRITLTNDEKDASVTIRFQDDRAVFFHLGLGRIDALSKPILEERWAALGAEPLSPHYRPDLWARAYRHTARSIKSCLMDQKVVCGIGNVYSDEILYRIGVYPGTPALALTQQKWALLGETVPIVLQSAVDLGGVGSPLTPEDTNTGQYRSQLAVHYRQGEPCGRGGTVRTERIAGHTSYWCPAVQSPRH